MSRLLCGIGVVIAFFWLFNHAAHFSSSASLLCILKQRHHFFQRVILGSFFATIFLAVVTEIVVGLTDCGRWLPFSIPWISFYILFLFYKVQLPSPADPLIILLLSPWLRIQQWQCSSGWNMQGSVRSPETQWLFVHTHRLQANRSQVRTVTFRRHLNPCVHIIRKKTSRVCKLLIRIIWVCCHYVLKKQTQFLI